MRAPSKTSGRRGSGTGASLERSSASGPPVCFASPVGSSDERRRAVKPRRALSYADVFSACSTRRAASRRPPRSTRARTSAQASVEWRGQPRPTSTATHSSPALGSLMSVATPMARPRPTFTIAVCAARSGAPSVAAVASTGSKTCVVASGSVTHSVSRQGPMSNTAFNSASSDTTGQTAGGMPHARTHASFVRSRRGSARTRVPRVRRRERGPAPAQCERKRWAQGESESSLDGP
mmetsp:Transcript_10618/g.26775  ORF Transcript_10618/g.26775 Transcript_10618/m.26775 type:complete len:236 (+) Transcript_10618:247-954(+)